MERIRRQVTNCLKENIITKKGLSKSCSEHLRVIMEQQALHYKLDPVLVQVCDSDIRSFCSSEENDVYGQGGMEECLKKNFEQLTAIECKRHIAMIISVIQIDIQADPLLHRACAVDLVSLCKDVPPGDGRRLKCLLRFKDQSGAIKLDPKCYEMLTARTQLYSSASRAISLESVNVLVEQLSISPARNFFLVMGFSLIGVILMLGIFCGRATKGKMTVAPNDTSPAELSQ